MEKDREQGTGNGEQELPDGEARLPANGAPPTPLESAPLAYANPAFLNGPDGD